MPARPWRWPFSDLWALAQGAPPAGTDETLAAAHSVCRLPCWHRPNPDRPRRPAYTLVLVCHRYHGPRPGSGRLPRSSPCASPGGARIWATLGPDWVELGPMRPFPSRCWLSLVKLGPDLADVGPTLVMSQLVNSGEYRGQSWPLPRPCRSIPGQCLSIAEQCRPKLGDTSGETLSMPGSKADRSRSKVCRLRANVLRMWRMLAQHCPKSGHIRSKSVQNSSISAKILLILGKIWSKSVEVRPNLVDPKHPPKSVQCPSTSCRCRQVVIGLALLARFPCCVYRACQHAP